MADERERLLTYIDNNMAGIYSFFAKIVSIDTINYISTGNEIKCQQFIYNEFKEFGANVQLYNLCSWPGIEDHPDFMKMRGAVNRPNVTIHIPCSKEYENTAKDLMLTTHIDTMPAGDISQWRTNPFELTIIDGKAYGLGVSDNKCGSAILYAIYNAIKENNIRLKNNLYLTVVSDEEYFGGNGSLLACLKYPCHLYINLDGSDFEPQIAALGGTSYELGVKYKHDTSTAEPVIKALYFACNQLETFGEERYKELELNPLYVGTEHARSAYRVVEFGSGTFGTDVDIGRMKIVIYTTQKNEELKRELDGIFTNRIKPYFDKNGILSAGFKQSVRFIEYTKTHNTEYAHQLCNLMSQLSGKELKMRGACLSDLDIYLRNGSMDSFNVGLIREFKLEGGAHKPNEFILCEDFENLIKSLLLFVTQVY